MHRSLKYHEHALLLILFGGLFVYFLYGAIVGDLFIPARRGPGGSHLTGVSAWLVVLAPVLIYVAILIRHGLVTQLGSRIRTALELLLLFAGVAALYAGILWK